MNQKEQLINSGFQVLETENQENKLINFLKENYPSIIRDNEINLNELKTLSGLPVDEKVNGYGLNFVGRNVARAKYASKTKKEVKVNHNQSKNFDTTQNLVLKGDNLESLKILKSHYSGAIKCIYIDPPYNTKNDEFVYPDKFDKEEAEVLGLANLSESDMERMEFSFKTKQSHNGWLSFMYPRLLLARDLLAKDGVIFISIDDNEQANLKLLCDEVFGEENFYSMIIVRSNSRGQTYNQIAKTHENLLVYTKSNFGDLYELSKKDDNTDLNLEDEIGKFNIRELRNRNPKFGRHNRPNLYYPIYTDDSKSDKNGFFPISLLPTEKFNIEILPLNSKNEESCWRWGTKKLEENNDFSTLKSNIIAKKKTDGSFGVFEKYRKTTFKSKSIWDDNSFLTETGTVEMKKLGFSNEFDFPKPVELIKRTIELATENNDIILDFFAGSGTTGQAVMQLNAEDGGSRKFILCQIDEPIKKDKPAYQFCVDNNLPPVISSITIERLNRAGEKIKAEIETENTKTGMFDDNKKQIPDIGYKVFDTINAPELEMEVNGQIVYPSLADDALSRIYNLIFSVGIDSPVSALECVVENTIYKIGNNYYITNSAEAKNEDIANAIRKGKVFVDGWSAGINTTLQHYKEDVKIVF